MSIGKRLVKLRAEKSKTADDVINAIDISRSALSLWENDKRTPSNVYITRLANFYGVTEEYILNGDKSEKISDSIAIPVLDEIVSGVPIFAIQEILDYEEIPAEWARQGEFFGLRVKDSSMEPSLRAGDTVILKQQQSCDDGNICAVLVGNKNATLKLVYKSEFGITLKAENKAEFQDKSYSNREIETLPVTIIGVAVEVRRKLI